MKTIPAKDIKVDDKIVLNDKIIQPITVGYVETTNTGKVMIYNDFVNSQEEKQSVYLIFGHGLHPNTKINVLSDEDVKYDNQNYYTVSQQLLEEAIAGLKVYGGVATDFTVRKLQELTPVNDDY